MEINRISQRSYTRTMLLAIGLSMSVIVVGATLARSALNLNAALTDKPDLAVHVLLKSEGVREVELLEDNGSERHYFVRTTKGNKLIVLEKNESEWFIKTTENLHE